MGFIDYVAEYFRGPAGADGATGPAGPDTFHVLADLVIYSAEPSIPDGAYSNNFTLPEGAQYVSVTLNPFSSDLWPGTLSATVAQSGPTQYHLTTTVSGVTGVYQVHAQVLYRLPA